jgi:dTMP kinase
LHLTTRGKFITFEGGEGAGKSTQIGLLADTLRRAGIDPVLTREPGGSPGAEAIRTLLLGGLDEGWDATTEALLVSAARRDHVRRKIEPALEAGRWVLCDRFADSTTAYQGFAGGTPEAELETLYRIAVGSLRPDLTLILDLPVEIGLARAASRRAGQDRFERRGADFHERLRAGFLEVARREPARCAVIDAARDVAAVHRDILQTVSSRLGAALSPS